MSTVIEKTQPRLSLNALVTYLNGTAIKRRRIIADQKRPQAAGMMYYQPAQMAIARFLASTERNALMLAEALGALHAQPVANSYDDHRWQSNIQAVEAFLEFHEQLNRSGYVPSLGGNVQPKLQFNGLDVSIRPEVMLRGSSERFGPTVGAIRLYFGKHDRLTEESGKYTSAMLLEFLRQNYADRQAMPRATLVVDVFAQTIHEAPIASQRLLNDVKAACGEIARMWDA